MMLKLLIFVCAIGCLTEKSESWRVGENKYWLPDLDWLSENNWMNGIKPESNSRVVFPLEIYHSVGLPGNSLLQLSGIELPRDGSLLLSRQGNLQISDAITSRGKTSIWKIKGPFYWVDPENWSDSNEAVPHFERIPCSMDTVVLPDDNHALSIRLPDTSVKVKQIKIGNEKTIDEWHWHSLMSGREFHKSPLTVSYSGLQYCGSDCICKPDNAQELLEEICKIQRPRCGKLACEFPLKVKDHCCDYCGGRVSVASESISVSKLGEITKEALKNNKDIYWHARFAPDNLELEVLVAERGIYSGIKTQEAIDKLVQLLMVEGIPVVKKATTGAPLTGSALGNILGPILGAPIVILIIIIVGLSYFGYSYTYVLSLWREAYGTVRDGIAFRGDDGFARFENLPEGDVKLSAPSISSDNQELGDNSDTSGGGKRFENPLYRSTRKSPDQQDFIPNQNSESMINIDLPVSLTELKKKVYSSSSSSDPDIDSD